MKRPPSTLKTSNKSVLFTGLLLGSLCPYLYSWRSCHIKWLLIAQIGNTVTLFVCVYVGGGGGGGGGGRGVDAGSLNRQE